MTETDTGPDIPRGLLATCGTADFSGIHAEILLGGEAAPLTAMALTVAPALGAPAHISFTEDKLFTVTRGHLLFLVGNDRFLAECGASVFVPQGDVHSFSALDGSACMMLVATPARHDRFFQAMGSLPLPHRPEEVQAVCERYEQAIVGPVVQP
ncbi:cupin domain-containing protein [Altericroceibacterium spongiae]|nr:cupin domain-containing protein [Altericroceibacterium spongiae]